MVSDSVSCLSKKLTEKYAIEIVPISLIINGSVYRDGVDITPTKVYQLLETTKSVPTTSSPSPGDFVQVYREFSELVDGVVCVTICRPDISMMFYSATKAKQIAAEAETLKKRIESRFKCVELCITDFAPTMGVQAGPGTLALAFYSEEDGNVG
jgi:fatty acid-binding protein DegV